MKRSQIVVAALAIFALPAFGQDSITPSTVTATIPWGQSLAVPKVVSIGKQLAPVDIMFVIDATGSMNPAISALATDFAHTVTMVAGFASNVQFGVANYLDGTDQTINGCPNDPWAYQVNQVLTSNTSVVQTALNNVANIPASLYGCDGPESGTNGLYLAATTTPWRTGSTRIIVWVGDAPSHDPDVIVVSTAGSPAETVTPASAIAALQAAKVTVIAASSTTGPGLDAQCYATAGCGTSNSPGSGPNQAMQIATATGGQDLGSLNPSTPSTLTVPIENAINNKIATYSSVGLGVSPPAGVGVGIGPTNPVTGAFNRSVTNTFNYTETFTGLFPGVYSFATNALVNGSPDPGVVETDAITVTAQPPSISKAFSPASIPLGGSSTLTISITNPNIPTLTGVTFTDPLPPGVLLTGVVSNNCGLAVATPNSIGLSNGVVSSAGCAIVITVTGTTPGVKNNLTSNVTSNEAGTGNQASAQLLVVAPPVISKTFTPVKILPGGTSVVSFQIANPNNFASLTGVAFTDALPGSLVVANPNGLTSTCGGTATATPGLGTVSLVNGTIGASGSCTVTVTVTAPEGIYVNSVQVTSANGGTGNTSTATLYVATPPNLSKVFGEVSIGPLNTTTLSFTLMNPNHIVTLTGLTFTDPLPTGLVVATPSVISGVCDSGTITAVAGSSSITMGIPTGATLGPGAGCTFAVNVTANGAALGLLTNTTSTVTSNEALPGAAASATIFIGDPFQIIYAANMAVGDSYFDITNGGASGAGLNSANLANPAATTGAICANVYAFTPDEQMVSCCSCPVTPNGLNSLSAKLDLANNTLTAAPVSALVVKILATLPVGNSCANSAASVAGAALANGIKAYGTTIHATPAGTYGVTERPFSAATLSAGELSRLGNLCNFIVANGSGYGICSSCSLGGLGAVRQ